MYLLEFYIKENMQFSDVKYSLLLYEIIKNRTGFFLNIFNLKREFI